MRRSTLALLGLGAVAIPLRAQQVPGRDLLEFPVGAMGEAPALARESAGGLWNPAQLTLEGGLARLSVTAMNTPIEQGVNAYFAGANARVKGGSVVSVTVLRALVTDLLRTETDPQSLGDEIPYSTTVLSAGISRAFRAVSVGMALRHRDGVADLDRGSATSLDGGVSVDRFGPVPLRIAASTFLFSPWARSRERARYLAAADVPLFTRTAGDLRLGASVGHTERGSVERYLFASGRWGMFSARGGVATDRYAGNSTDRLRMGFGLHYSRYEIGLARETSGAGLGPTYQFMLSSVFR